MKQKVMDGLQRFSKAMFVPVLILPIAGILIAIGNIFTNQKLLEVVNSDQSWGDFLCGVSGWFGEEEKSRGRIHGFADFLSFHQCHE